MSRYYPSGIFSVGSSLREGYPPIQSHCHYEIQDLYTIASVVQDYYSQTLSARDVEYAFPLLPSAAVCSFKAVTEDLRIITKNKEEAERDFVDAAAQGVTTGLLRQEHVDKFRVSLGNIQPNQKISVHISFVSIAPHDGDSPQSLRVTMPTAIAPRYGQAPPNIPWFNANMKNRFPTYTFHSDEQPCHRSHFFKSATRGAVIENLIIEWGFSELEWEPEGDFELVWPSEAGPMPQIGLPPINLFDE